MHANTSAEVLMYAMQTRIQRFFAVNVKDKP